MPFFIRLVFVALLLFSPVLVHAEPSALPSPPLRTAFGSRCAKSPIPCNRIDYFSAHFHIADVILLPATDSRGFAATTSYGASMSLFHRIEVGIGGTLSVLDTDTGTSQAFATLPAEITSVRRDRFTGRVYAEVRTSPPQIIELSADGKKQTMFQQAPRVGRIAISPDGYLYHLSVYPEVKWMSKSAIVRWPLPQNR